jgi:hypothetical protein
VTNLTNNVNNIINNTMQSNTVQNIFASVNNLNSASMAGLKASCNPAYKSPGACGPTDQTGCDFVIDQNLKASVEAKGVADALTQALANTITANTTDTSVSQSATQSNTGLDGLISAITGPYAMICIACVCLLCIVCLGLLAFGLSPGGQAATQTAAQAGANYAAKH